MGRNGTSWGVVPEIGDENMMMVIVQFAATTTHPHNIITDRRCQDTQLTLAQSPDEVAI